MTKALNRIHDIPGVPLGKEEDGFKRVHKASVLRMKRWRRGLLRNRFGAAVYAVMPVVKCERPRTLFLNTLE